MRIMLTLLGSAAVAIALVLIIGAFLPTKHRATRQIVLDRSPEEIFAVIRDFSAAATWRPGLTSVEVLEPVDGRLRFREKSRSRSVTYEVVEEASNTRLVTRIVDRDLGYFGSWTYELSSAGPTKTVLRITEDGEVPNILFRFMSRFVFGHTSTLDSYLRALGRKFGENVTPA